MIEAPIFMFKREVPINEREQWLYAEQLLAALNEKALIRLVTKSFGQCLDIHDFAGAARWESLSLKIDALLVSSLRGEGAN